MLILILFLLMQLSSVEEPMRSDEIAILIEAIEHGTSEDVIRALAKVEDVNIVVDEKGNTPLIHAVRQSHRRPLNVAIAIVEVLLENGAGANHQNVVGASALTFAASVDSPAMTMALLEHGADVEVKSGSREDTPLHVASMFGNVHVAVLLLDYGAEVNSLDAQGRTPLHYAVQFGQWPIVPLLLGFGADGSKLDDEGISPLELARRRVDENPHKGRVRLLRFLERAVEEVKEQPVGREN